MKETPNNIKAVVSASAIGWYGPDTDASKQFGFKEDAASLDDFLGKTCKLWEESIQPVEALNKRLVITSDVLIPVTFGTQIFYKDAPSQNVLLIVCFVYIALFVFLSLRKFQRDDL